MLEFSLTEGQPLQRPYQCVVCGGNLGVMLNTHREIPSWGNVYVCETCARHVARIFGMVKGKRMEQLTQAADTIESLEADLQKMHEWGKGEEARATELSMLADSLREELALARARVTQLEGRFAEYAQGALEMAGVTSDEGSE